MVSTKRKFPGAGAARRVRARKEPEVEPEDYSDSENPSVSEENASASEEASEGDSGSDSEGSESGASSESTTAANQISKVSFGELARAQASAPLRARTKHGGKYGDEAGDDDDDDDDDREARQPDGTRAAAKPPAARPRHGRSSKHAPAEVTSKRPVTRRREVVAVARAAARDPRFDPLAGRLDEEQVQRAYGFLDEYRDDEMRALRAAARKAKDAGAREQLLRAAASLESRKKARLRREREQAVLEEHRRQEKELVGQGKKPFYLKRSEQKKRVLLDQYEKMSKKQVDKAIEKKRKKAAVKDRIERPLVRREG